MGRKRSASASLTGFPASWPGGRATRESCAEIAAGAPLTILHARRALGLIAGLPGHAGEEEIDRLARACFDSADYAEGRAAFAEKRKPRFTGK